MTLGEANKILGIELGRKYTIEDIQVVSIYIIIFCLLEAFGAEFQLVPHGSRVSHSNKLSSIDIL